MEFIVLTIPPQTTATAYVNYTRTNSLILTLLLIVFHCKSILGFNNWLFGFYKWDFDFTTVYFKNVAFLCLIFTMNLYSKSVFVFFQLAVLFLTGF